MAHKDFLIGKLKAGGYLETSAGDVLLSKMTDSSSAGYEAQALEIPPENKGKTALATGRLSQNVLYSARIVEVFSFFNGALYNILKEKGILSLEEVKRNLWEILSQDREEDSKVKLCALVIGHKKSSPGATNVQSNLSEFEFNEELAFLIEKQTDKADIQRIYRRTYQELPEDINRLGPDFVISLHCNAFDGQVSGTEVLYYHRSEKGRIMARILQNKLLEHLRLPDRGIKPKASEDRGGYLLRYTLAPCVIAEPFFIDNDSDLNRAREDIHGLAAAYAAGIEEISLELA